MTYEETTEYLFNQMPMFERQGKTGYKEGLENTIALDAHFNHPHRNYKTIHIAGTNGKGSCAHTIAAILQNLGFKVGLYTSPHIIDFRERIRVNGICISEEYIIDFVESEREFFEPLHPSFFEVTTAMAFKYFSDMNVDIAIIEVGLGGRLDCTNIISPILSVITNISFDHTQFLGNTLEAIASEKAGIIKAGTPVVIGEATEATGRVFKNKAHKKGSEIIFAEDKDEILNYTHTTDGYIEYDTRSFGRFKGELSGDYQIKNTATILAAIKTLMAKGYIKNDINIKDIIKKSFKEVNMLTGFMGRWQKISDKPTVICDAGHNTGGWEYISKQLNKFKDGDIHIIFGMVNDKDIESVMAMMPENAHYYFTKPDSKRALNEHKIKEIAGRYGLDGDCFATIKDAYHTARNTAKENDMIFIGGSCYIISDFMRTCF